MIEARVYHGHLKPRHTLLVVCSVKCLRSFKKVLLGGNVGGAIIGNALLMTVASVKARESPGCASRR